MYTLEDIKRFEKELEGSPDDTDLMNKIAIGYMEHPCEFIEDLKLFERAYQIKQTIKTANNLAYQLFYEFETEANQKRALNLQAECISKKPKSYMPYHLSIPSPKS